MDLSEQSKIQVFKDEIKNVQVGPSLFLLVRFSLKFMFSRKTTKIDEIFTFDLTLCTKCQIDGEDFVNFCGLLRKYELYLKSEVAIASLFLQNQAAQKFVIRSKNNNKIARK